VYRFLLTPRWLGGHLFVVVAVVFCVFMGSWQLSRFEARVQTQRTAGEAPKAAAKAAPLPLGKALPTVSSQVTADTVGRVVSATGRYDTARELRVPGRTLDGRTGFYVLDLLRVDGGAALPVVRGWLPGNASSTSAASRVPAPPGGETTVTGYLQAPEGPDTDGVDTQGGLPSGQLGMISAASLINLVPYDVYGGWVTATQAAAPMKAVPYAAPAGSGLDLKAFQNLGYTGEWFVFAGFVVFMWFRLMRREAEMLRDAELGLVTETGAGPVAEAGAAGSPEATSKAPGPQAAPDASEPREAPEALEAQTPTP
jgi:cytochrome oxidase assembly protein ShyY1